MDANSTSTSKSVEILQEVSRHLTETGATVDRNVTISTKELPDRNIHLWRLDTGEGKNTQVVVLFQKDRRFVDYRIVNEGLQRAMRKARAMLKSRIDTEPPTEVVGSSIASEKESTS